MADHNDFGKEGEDAALQYLAAKGYELLEQNWRRHPFEVDLIMRDGPILVIIEVKARSSVLFGNPESFVSRQKQSHLIVAANAYIRAHRCQSEVRFDVVALSREREGFSIKHIPNAFYPTLRR